MPGDVVVTVRSSSGRYMLSPTPDGLPTTSGFVGVVSEDGMLRVDNVARPEWWCSVDLKLFYLPGEECTLADRVLTRNGSAPDSEIIVDVSHLRGNIPASHTPTPTPTRTMAITNRPFMWQYFPCQRNLYMVCDVVPGMWLVVDLREYA